LQQNDFANAFVASGRLNPMKNAPMHFIAVELSVQVAIRWGTQGRSDNKHSQQDRNNKTGPAALLHQAR
jgi:hypothetical protein